MSVQKLGVVGAGQMGSGIAQVAAQAGLSVTVLDTFPGATERASANIRKSLAKLAEKKQINETPEAIFDRIRFVADIKSLAAAAPDLVVEAVSENFEVKAKLFKELDEQMPVGCVLASNTSSIAITRIAAVTKRPGQVIGMHFMNPVPLMKLVEIIRGLATSDACYATVKSLAEKMGKTTVLSKDMPGFIVNRILMPMINEAVFALNEGLASPADIDTAMKLGTNQPMGPLQLADFIGLDTCLAIMEVLHEGLGDSKYRPAPLLRQYVQAGWVGKKSKRGFYTYE
ncbi:MAG: 3-hydroxybutyryl-CoA dehydrogenase [Bdellovibrionales bacterium]|nr:3-hydroxybutyryl-CoA dehydrogenase [Bdellovibrionales bacterium]